MMDPRAEAVEWLRNHIAVHDPEENRWVPIGVLLPLMSRKPWPPEWAEPSPWDPLVYHVVVEAGSYQVEATARVWRTNQWVVAYAMDCGWNDTTYQHSWIANDLDDVLACLVALVDGILGVA